MQVVIVEPEKKPVVQNIDDTLTSMQQIVGGTIQAVYHQSLTSYTFTFDYKICQIDVILSREITGFKHKNFFFYRKPKFSTH